MPWLLPCYASRVTYRIVNISLHSVLWWMAVVHINATYVLDDRWFLFSFFSLILHGHMIELKCVTTDKKNKCTTGIELLITEFNLVSFSRRRGNSKCFWLTVIVFSFFWFVRFLSNNTFFHIVGQYWDTRNWFESIVLCKITLIFAQLPKFPIFYSVKELVILSSQLRTIEYMIQTGIS